MKRIYGAATNVFAAVAILAFTPYVVSAAFEVFTGESLFLKAVGPTAPDTEDFESAKPGTVMSGETPTFGTLGFSYSGGPDDSANDPTDGQPLIRDSGVVNGTREFVGEVNADGSPSGIHTFSFPYPVNSFGALFNSTLTGAKLTISAAGKTIKFSKFLSGDGSGFLGFTSSTAFGWVSFGTEIPASASLRQVSDRFRCSLAEAPSLSVPGQTTSPCANTVASSEVFSLDNVVYSTMCHSPPCGPPCNSPPCGGQGPKN
jgi:hypothetical protein